MPHREPEILRANGRAWTHDCNWAWKPDPPVPGYVYYATEKRIVKTIITNEIMLVTSQEIEIPVGHLLFRATIANINAKIENTEPNTVIITIPIFAIAIGLAVIVP